MSERLMDLIKGLLNSEVHSSSVLISHLLSLIYQQLAAAHTTVSGILQQCGTTGCTVYQHNKGKQLLALHALT